MSRTRILVALLIFVMLVQLFPEHAVSIKLVWVTTVGLYALIWAMLRYREHYRAKSAAAAQLAADDRDYQEYKAALDVIRAKYDPQRDLNDPTDITPEYRDELAALHEKYQLMLDRKFGVRS